MNRLPSELPFLSNMGLLLTFKCTTACPHCVVEAGPHRKEEIPLSQAFDWISQASHYRDGHIWGLALTGGEPFCIPGKLSDIVHFAGEHQFLISAVTNAFWASSEQAALDTLAMLPEVLMYSVSTDAYHLKTIPLRNVLNLVRACQKMDRSYNIAICTDNLENPEYLAILDKIGDVCPLEQIRTSITYPVGRARNMQRKFNYATCTEAPVSACTMAGSPIAFPDGRMLACIGPVVDLPRPHPLYLGNLNEEPLAAILNRAELNPVLHIIRVWGPHKLASMLQEGGLGEYLPHTYMSACVCDICYQLMSHPRLLAALLEMMEDQDLQKYLAYARLYYLNETQMVDLLQLTSA